jgi:regulator of sigma E protease
VRRKGKRLKLDVEPDRKSGLIGVVFRHDIEFVDASLGERLGKAVGYPVVLSWRMLQGFGKLFKWDKKTVESAKGPVGIVQEMEKRFRGPIGEASLMVIILSVLLGLFNLLPIPALDGGRLVFQLVELISRRRLNPRTEAKVHYIGFMLLLGLILLLTVRDIRGCFGW